MNTLVLDENQITSVQRFPYLPNLRTLSLNNNKITDVAVFLNDLDRMLPSLNFLSLYKNPACPNFFTGKDDEDYTRYRYYVLFRLKTLKYLDTSPVTPQEMKEAQRVGKWMKVARPESQRVAPIAAGPSASASASGESISAAATTKTPDELPSDLRKEGEHSSHFGTARYIYYGRESEGNRFILNSDL
eukprot:TRINITY_DN9843_c0_g1_i2.p1 TRINITY_DN9843_c0_g1~~TRINITY_DN9843_c0_g1_i2.p1  ORF type:complete len:188 (-),score=38.39 TRINITY_DN9843_c0_g1_i2:39-602(-)